MAEFLSAIELMAEQRIQEALTNGEFENLAGEGRPLELEDMGLVPPELRMAYKLLKNAGYVPEEIANRNEIITLTTLLDSCGDEQEKTAAIGRLRYLLERMRLGPARHAALEANDEYYQKALAKLARFD